MTEKYQQVLKVASELYEHRPDWVTFFREVLGIDGLLRQAFAEPEALSRFKQSPEYAEIQQMLAALRVQNGRAVETQEPMKVITVRLPQSLHQALRAEAEDRNTSMNKLCISKLLQVIDAEELPVEVT